MCAPDNTVKIPKIICKKSETKTNKVVFLKYTKSLYLNVIVPMIKNNKNRKYAIFLCINWTNDGDSKEFKENKFFKLESLGK